MQFYKWNQRHVYFSPRPQLPLSDRPSDLFKLFSACTNHQQRYCCITTWTVYASGTTVKTCCACPSSCSRWSTRWTSWTAVWILTINFNWYDWSSTAAGDLRQYYRCTFECTGISVQIQFDTLTLFDTSCSDQEIPSNQELARDSYHPVYYYLCEILHLAKWRLLRAWLGKDVIPNGFWRWERFWQTG